MKNECKGLFGKWFGHYYVSRIVEYNPANVEGLNFKGYGKYK